VDGYLNFTSCAAVLHKKWRNT